MTESTLSIFQPSIEKTSELLKMMEGELGWSEEDRKNTYIVLKTVLQALRDRLLAEEAADLAAQLPMLVRGFYYEGWQPAKVPIKMTRYEFILRVKTELGALGSHYPAEELVRAAVKALSNFITSGELENVKTELPNDLAKLLDWEE